MNILFDKEAIVPDLPGIVLISHGALAIGIIDSAKMIIGDIQNVAAFSLESADSPDEYWKAVAEGIEAFTAGCIVLVDLFAGTPFNQLLMYALRSTKEVHALCGLNLPMLLEVALSRGEGEDIGELLRGVEESAKSSIKSLSQTIASARQKDEETN